MATSRYQGVTPSAFRAAVQEQRRRDPVLAQTAEPVREPPLASSPATIVLDAIDRRVTYVLRLLDSDGDDILNELDIEEWVDRLGALRDWEPGSDGYSALTDLFLNQGYHGLRASAGRGGGADAAARDARRNALARTRAPARLIVWADALFDVLDDRVTGRIGVEEYRDLLFDAVRRARRRGGVVRRDRRPRPWPVLPRRVQRPVPRVLSRRGPQGGRGLVVGSAAQRCRSSRRSKCSVVRTSEVHADVEDGLRQGALAARRIVPPRPQPGAPARAPDGARNVRGPRPAVRRRARGGRDAARPLRRAHGARCPHRVGSRRTRGSGPRGGSPGCSIATSRRSSRRRGRSSSTRRSARYASQILYVFYALLALSVILALFGVLASREAGHGSIDRAALLMPGADATVLTVRVPFIHTHAGSAASGVGLGVGGARMRLPRRPALTMRAARLPESRRAPHGHHDARRRATRFRADSERTLPSPRVPLTMTSAFTRRPWPGACRPPR